MSGSEEVRLGMRQHRLRVLVGTVLLAWGTVSLALLLDPRGILRSPEVFPALLEVAKGIPVFRSWSHGWLAAYMLVGILAGKLSDIGLVIGGTMIVFGYGMGRKIALTALAIRIAHHILAAIPASLYAFHPGVTLDWEPLASVLGMEQAALRAISEDQLVRIAGLLAIARHALAILFNTGIAVWLRGNPPTRGTAVDVALQSGGALEYADKTGPDTA